MATLIDIKYSLMKIKNRMGNTLERRIAFDEVKRKNDTFYRPVSFDMWDRGYHEGCIHSIEQLLDLFDTYNLNDPQVIPMIQTDISNVCRYHESQKNGHAERCQDKEASGDLLNSNDHRDAGFYHGCVRTYNTCHDDIKGVMM